ncbi:MAG TPA: hypothetical protein VL492_12210 [Methylovirgula sp.]|nr:hypothetical protein [Methylovirgula sp.]
MSHIPTQVRAVIEVDLPRPRDLTTIFRDDRANAIKIETLSLLHEEAMKAFSGGSRAAADFIEAYRKRAGRSRLTSAYFRPARLGFFARRDWSAALKKRYRQDR